MIIRLEQGEKGPRLKDKITNKPFKTEHPSKDTKSAIAISGRLASQPWIF